MSTSHVDARGLRFAAAITSVVLAVALLVVSPVREILVAAQFGVFALGAFAGLDRSPYGILFKTFARPLLGRPTHLEDSRPPRFAQLVGFAFVAIALVSLLLGATTLGLVAIAFALVAALLNATTGFCLGCELYLVLRRVTSTTPTPHVTH
ncbi:DUF4395 domain-containing protein [soil metagenome]